VTRLDAELGRQRRAGVAGRQRSSTPGILPA
jgi:hypothetical protein